MFLDGFGIGGYRSFDDDIVFIKDLKKVNFFIGKNNCGKSNILKFCAHLSKIQLNKVYNGFDNNLDICKGSKVGAVQFALQIKKGSQATGKLYNNIMGVLPNLFNKVPDWRESFWLKFNTNCLGVADKTSNPTFSDIKKRILDNYDETATNQLTNKYLHYTGGTQDSRAEDLSKHIIRILGITFHFQFIGAFRQITNQGTGSLIDGTGLIGELRKLQNPTLDKLTINEAIFSAINNFLRELLDEKSALIRIPAELDKILVSIKNRTLPLESLGTGIHELIIMAAAVTITKNTVFCIEEPEIHIHPELLKKFIKYIQINTTNQYLITTHSNACLDFADVNVYHCRLVDDHTKCELRTTDRERIGILSDLGYKSSDLLQSNCIIWVEGPSDRIYLNHWIKGMEPSLEEGLHYSIMFYGGRLLNHLTFDSTEVNEFIRLCRINQNAAIIIDSDKKTAHSHINPTKRRVKLDFERNSALAWITSGREIENYIPNDIFIKSVSSIYKIVRKKAIWGRFTDINNIMLSKKVDKIYVAKKVIQEPPDYTQFDLNTRIQELIIFIKRSNLLS